MSKISNRNDGGNGPVVDELLTIIAEGVARLRYLYGPKLPPEARRAVIYLFRARAALKRVAA